MENFGLAQNEIKRTFIKFCHLKYKNTKEVRL